MDVTKSGATPPLGLEELLALTQISEEPPEEAPEEGSGSDAESPSSDGESISSMASSAFARRLTMPAAQSAPIIQRPSRLSTDLLLAGVFSPTTTNTPTTVDEEDDPTSWSQVSSQQSSRSRRGSIHSSAPSSSSSPSGSVKVTLKQFYQRIAKFRAADPSEVTEAVQSTNYAYRYTDHARDRKKEREVSHEEVTRALIYVKTDNAFLAKCTKVDQPWRKDHVYRFIGPEISSNAGTSSTPTLERVVVIADIQTRDVITVWKTTKIADKLRLVFGRS